MFYSLRVVLPKLLDFFFICNFFIITSVEVIWRNVTEVCSSPTEVLVKTHKKFAAKVTPLVVFQGG